MTQTEDIKAPEHREKTQTGYYVGERERHRSRETGATVVLVDTLTTPQWMPGDYGRWVTLCDDHGYIKGWPTLSAARAWYAYPSEWCPTCRRTLSSR